MLFWFLFFSVIVVIHPITHAAEIITKPSKSYVQSGSGHIYNSLGELIASINERSQATFDQCIQQETYGCTKQTLTGAEPSPTIVTIVNGEPLFYDLLCESFYQAKLSSNLPIQTHTTTMPPLGATVRYECPPNFSLISTSVPGGYNRCSA